MKKLLIIALLFSMSACIKRHYSADITIDTKNKAASGRINKTEFDTRENLKEIDE